jgi:hypothetical protein
MPFIAQEMAAQFRSHGFSWSQSGSDFVERQDLSPQGAQRTRRNRSLLRMPILTKIEIRTLRKPHRVGHPGRFLGNKNPPCRKPRDKGGAVGQPSRELPTSCKTGEKWGTPLLLFRSPIWQNKKRAADFYFASSTPPTQFPSSQTRTAHGGVGSGFLLDRFGDDYGVGS